MRANSFLRQIVHCLLSNVINHLINVDFDLENTYRTFSTFNAAFFASNISAVVNLLSYFIIILFNVGLMLLIFTLKC